MSTSGNGTCTWTWDGAYWTCVDNCKDGSVCADIDESSTGQLSTTHPLTKDDPAVKKLLPGVKKDHPHPPTGKKTWGIPDDLFRLVVGTKGLKAVPHIDTTTTSKAQFPSASSLPVNVVIDCV